jgi:predicted GIY-YIG superfamily endonuclease
MEDITIKALLYVLELEGGNYYIGITHHLNVRLAQHYAGTGAKWTKLFKPLKLVEVVMDASRTMEDEITKKYMLLYGHDKVRGGSWTKC